MAETIPGGYYIGANGQPHDANGKPLSPRPVPRAVPVTVETAPADPAPEDAPLDRVLTDPGSTPSIPVDEPISAKPKRTPKAK